MSNVLRATLANPAFTKMSKTRPVANFARMGNIKMNRANPKDANQLVWRGSTLIWPKLLALLAPVVSTKTKTNKNVGANPIVWRVLTSMVPRPLAMNARMANTKIKTNKATAKTIAKLVPR